MHLALEAPERVERLVLAATSARFGTPETWDERIALVRSGGMEAVADAVLPRWFTPAFGDVQRFRAMLVVDAARGVRALLRDSCASTTCAAGSARSRRRRSRSPARRIRLRRPSSSRRSPPRSRTRASSSSRAPRISSNVERADEFNDALLAHLA